MMIKQPTLDHAWFRQLEHVMAFGRETSPRGQLTMEVPSKTLSFDMNYPVITNPDRKLGYKFMAAEAWWILAGLDDVESIKPYSKNISNFSDDGHKFFGAYGPPIIDQLPYVVDTLLKDPDTRQAVMITWKPKPGPTKDVPCTVAFDWLIREGKLEAHVFMRSSDNWLGIPYDAFNFTMLSCEIARRVNINRWAFNELPPIGLGDLHLTAASSHIYERDFMSVKKVLTADPVWKAQYDSPTPVPADFYEGSFNLVDRLDKLKDTKKGDPTRWWESWS